MGWFLRFIALCGAILLASCANLGGPEFEIYKAAFDKTNAASAAILDQLALHERALFLKTSRIARSATRFDPGLARYYTDSADPPGTAAFRGALDVVKSYNEVLYGLETGQTAQTLTAKLSAMEGSVSSAVVAVGGLASAAAPPASVALAGSMTAMNTAFTQLLPIIQTALTLRSQEAFRVFLVENYPLVRQLLLSLRSSTSAIFPVLTAAAVSSSIRDPGGALSAEDSQKIETYRKLLADWVILIEASIKALDRATAAAQAPPSITGTITGLTSVAIELETASKSARTHLAELAAK